MKVFKSIFIVLLLMCFFLTSCTEKDETEGLSNAEISEKAMENFVAKLEEGNYTIDAPEYKKTSVYSKDLVSFDYVEDVYDDYVIMSLDDESFQAYLKEDGSLDEVEFLGEGKAIDAAGSKLPSYLLQISNGNMFELFYNDTNEPLTFFSHEDLVKDTLRSFVGYNENAINLMEDVYLIMDKMDPGVVHLKAVVNDDQVARVFYDDIDVTISFGKAESNEAAEAWLKAPVYPEGKKEWDYADEFVLNSVFLTGYGLEAVPFPSFASYAMKMDQENFLMDDEVCIRDSKASQQDMKDYIATLLAEGFEKATEIDDEGNDKIVYRKLLREEYDCYSSINVEYNDGVDITARKYYDCPTYDDLDGINAVLKKVGYPVLDDSLEYESITAKDKASQSAESWLYFYKYDAVLETAIKVKDRQAAENYMAAYVDKLVNNGYAPSTESEVTEGIYYASENGFNRFVYEFTGDDTLNIQFKAEKYISPAEAEKLVTSIGFPAIKFSEPIACRDLTEFAKVRNGMDMYGYYTISQTFKNGEEAEKYLSDYEAALNEMGFDRVNPENVGSLKSVALYNEEKNMLVGIDYFNQENDALVNMDFEAYK
ncbi:MAG: hypothetical protein IJI46_02240 [Erysipelotrichaceae bacterium]|nr:hypothetical protein [Erysipelotrichaceae bacterium]